MCILSKIYLQLEKLISIVKIHKTANKHFTLIKIKLRFGKYEI